MSDDQTKVNKNGKPWASESAARKALKDNELDEKIWGVVPSDGGWVLEEHALTLQKLQEAKTADALENQKKAVDEEKYFWVVFPGRGDVRDAECVELSHNGDAITIRRETEVPLPQRYLNVADGAVQKVYEPLRRSSIPYREAGVVNRRAYRKVREASRKEFLEYLSNGNKITRKAILESGGRSASDNEA